TAPGGRARLAGLLRTGHRRVATAAATSPAGLQGLHVGRGAAIEVRLAARPSLAADRVRDFTAVVFGAGDFHTRTEERPPPPPLARGDRVVLGPLAATVVDLLGHPRLVALRFDGSPAAFWDGLARHGHPIQYAHLRTRLAWGAVWPPIAGPPAAFEPPSAGFALDWGMLRALRGRGVGFATMTLAAGISSTGDRELDRRLPFDEAYRVPAATAAAIE